MKAVAVLFFATALLGAAAVSGGEEKSSAPCRVIHSAGGGRLKTLDPAQADDLSSRDLAGAIFDTLVQYNYRERPYRLEPAMLTAMPVASDDYTSYRFELRDDLYFAPHPLFAGREERRITTKDVKYSLLRLADARNHSPLYWLIRGRIVGLDRFHERSAAAPAGDHSVYDEELAGFVIEDDRHFTIRMTRSDPRFLYNLAMPNAGIVPRRVVEHYGRDFARHPAGSGPFMLESWRNDYMVVLVRNPDYRREYFSSADTPADRTRPLPLADRIEISLIKQPMTSWLLFLQGNLDLHALDKDNLDMVGSGTTLPPALEARKIHLWRVPEFEIRYVGFNFDDPLLGKNPELRKALSLAYNVARRVEHCGNQLIPAQGPIPPGVAGFDGAYRNEFADDDLERAKEHLRRAGFPGGVDPATGEPLHFTFDQTGNSSAYRQLGELAAADFGKLGIRITPVLNNNPRFYEKMRQRKIQLFRLSWVGDYPDAENFLQLFYSGNCGGCNRTGFRDAGFDRRFEEIRAMPDSPERTAKYREMVRYLGEKCVWIYEGFPVSFLLTHDWLENYLPHDFAFSRWKYLSVEPRKREMRRSTFRPLSLSELR